MAYIEVDVDIDEHIDECSTIKLIKELKNRGYIVEAEDKKQKGIIAVKNYLCDLFGINYHTSNEVILRKLTELLKN